MQMKISVIIPTHNRPGFLSRAVNSVLAQTYSDIEVVVVDDNEPKTDNRKFTMNVMSEYSANEKVKYILNEKSLGGGLARNRGIKAATGDYITFLDDDDIYLPEKVERQLAFTLKNNLEMSFTDVFLHDENDKLVEYRRHDYVTDCSNQELLRQHILHSLGPTSTFMIKKSVLDTKGAFEDVPMGQDFMLMWRMIENNVKIGYLPESHIVQYLHSGERISVGRNKIQGENNLFKLKQTKHHLLSRKENRYVRFRHYAVLAFASKRSAKTFKMFNYGAYAMLVSPMDGLKEAKRMISNKRKAHNKKIEIDFSPAEVITKTDAEEKAKREKKATSVE